MFVDKCLPCLVILSVGIIVGCAKVQPIDSSSFTNWASQNAVVIEAVHKPFSNSNREALRLAVGSSRLVGLGESRHDTREQLLLKKGFVTSLVEEMDFRAIILEEGFSQVEALDRYITTGEGDIRALMTGLAGWYLWSTEEMLELIQWLREVNQSRLPGQMVHLYGMDITAPAPGVHEVLQLFNVAGVQTELDENALGLHLQEGDFWPTTWERYSALSNEQRVQLAENYREMVLLLEEEKEKILSTVSQDEYQRHLLLGRIALRGNELFSSSSREQGGEVREQGMAQIVLWLLSNKLIGSKAIVWSHNLHIAKSPFRMPGLAEGELIPLGFHLNESLGEDYLAFGGTFGAGAYSNSLPPGERVFEPSPESVMDGALAAVSVPVLFLDLRHVQKGSNAHRWLQEPREWKAQDSSALMVPGTAFDLVYFVNRISRSRPTDSALQRFQSMNR